MIGMPHPDGDEPSESGGLEADAGARAGWRGIAPGVLLVVVAGLAYFSVRNLPGPAGDMLGPGPMPRILAAILLVLGTVVAVEGFVGRRVDVRGSIQPPIVVASIAAAVLFGLSWLLSGRGA